MSRQDKTTEVTLRMLQGAPAPSIAPAGESPPMAELLRPRTTADTSARTMVYLPVQPNTTTRRNGKAQVPHH